MLNSLEFQIGANDQGAHLPFAYHGSEPDKLSAEIQSKSKKLNGNIESRTGSRVELNQEQI